MNDKILKGPDYHMKFPREALGKIFYDNLLKHKEKTAFVDDYTGEALTYGEAFEISCQLAQVYQNMELKIGDLIAIYSENSIYYFLPMIAALYLGVTTVHISHYYLEAEISHALMLTKPKVLFCSKRNYKQFLKIRKQFGFIKYIILMDFEEVSDGVENFSTIVYKYGNNKCMDLTLSDLDINKNIALILFSSGTTGLPKGVMLTQKNYISRILHTWDPTLIYFDPKNIVLGILPFFHSAGVIIYTANILLGNNIRVFWKFEERQYLKAIQNYRSTMLIIVPPIAIILAKSPIVDEYDLSSLEEVIVGAAALSKDIEKQMFKRLKLKSIRQMFGMTETTTNITCAPVNMSKEGSVGKLVPGMMAAIIHTESGEYLGPHQIGEIVVKGDLVMAGYYANPTATKEAFLDNGFLRTGDLGYYDEDEHFFFIDRLKELIKYNGFQVAPAELESLILKHPKVLDVGVIGIPDEKAGELPMAFVVKQPNAQDVTAEEIIKYVSDNMSHQKRLGGGVQFVDSIPKNASGKILRKELRKMINNATKSKL